MATRHGISPRFSSSSISTRCSRASEPWWARATRPFLGELVEPEREPLGEAAVVDEHDRRAVLLDEPEKLRVDRRPDRARAPFGARAGERVGGALARLAHVLDRDGDAQVELLREPGVDEADGPCARDEAPDLLHRPLRRREADALQRRRGETLEPLQREREVGAALRPGDGVHLVDDHGLDAGEHLATLRGEQEVERLGRRDEDVRRVPQHLAPLLLRRVAGPDGDAELRLEPGERAAEVALDVVVQRLQRRDVEQAEPLTGRFGQTVDPPEERGERLARPGRRLDEHVLAARDRRPGELLRRGRPGEGALEPRARARREHVERGGHVAERTSAGAGYFAGCVRRASRW